MSLSGYTLDQLVDIITHQVLAVYPPDAATCSGCGQACDGNCAATCPDRCRDVVGAGASRLSARLGSGSVASDLARMIDHTLLKPDATHDQIVTLCSEARGKQLCYCLHQPNLGMRSVPICCAAARSRCARWLASRLARRCPRSRRTRPNERLRWARPRSTWCKTSAHSSHVTTGSYPRTSPRWCR